MKKENPNPKDRDRTEIQPKSIGATKAKVTYSLAHTQVIQFTLFLKFMKIISFELKTMN